MNLYLATPESSSHTFAFAGLKSGKAVFQAKWVKEVHTQMAFYALRATPSIDIYERTVLFGLCWHLEALIWTGSLLLCKALYIRISPGLGEFTV